MVKGAYIKTLEAIIAIVLILTVVFVVIPKPITYEEKVPFNVKNAQEFIIKEIRENAEIRNAVFTNPTDAKNKISALIEENLPIGFTYAFEICDTTVCVLENTPLDRNVYMADVMLSNGEPRIVRIWFWQKSI